MILYVKKLWMDRLLVLPIIKADTDNQYQYQIRQFFTNIGQISRKQGGWKEEEEVCF